MCCCLSARSEWMEHKNCMQIETIRTGSARHRMNCSNTPSVTIRQLSTKAVHLPPSLLSIVVSLALPSFVASTRLHSSYYRLHQRSNNEINLCRRQMISATASINHETSHKISLSIKKSLRHRCPRSVVREFMISHNGFDFGKQFHNVDCQSATAVQRFNGSWKRKHCKTHNNSVTRCHQTMPLQRRSFMLQNCHFWLSLYCRSATILPQKRGRKTEKKEIQFILLCCRISIINAFLLFFRDSKSHFSCSRISERQKARANFLMENYFLRNAIKTMLRDFSTNEVFPVWLHLAWKQPLYHSED